MKLFSFASEVLHIKSIFIAGMFTAIIKLTLLWRIVQSQATDDICNIIYCQNMYIIAMEAVKLI